MLWQALRAKTARCQCTQRNASKRPRSRYALPIAGAHAPVYLLKTHLHPTCPCLGTAVHLKANLPCTSLPAHAQTHDLLLHPNSCETSLAASNRPHATPQRLRPGKADIGTLGTFNSLGREKEQSLPPPRPIWPLRGQTHQGMGRIMALSTQNYVYQLSLPITWPAAGPAPTSSRHARRAPPHAIIASLSRSWSCCVRSDRKLLCFWLVPKTLAEPAQKRQGS